MAYVGPEVAEEEAVVDAVDWIAVVGLEATRVIKINKSEWWGQTY
jgi:hypothetical protein